MFGSKCTQIKCTQISCTLHLEAHNRVVWRANQFWALKGTMVFFPSRQPLLAVHPSIMAGQTKFTRQYTGVNELFSGTQVGTNFYNGTHVKDSKKNPLKDHNNLIKLNAKTSSICVNGFHDISSYGFGRTRHIKVELCKRFFFQIFK